MEGLGGKSLSSFPLCALLRYVSCAGMVRECGGCSNLGTYKHNKPLLLLLLLATASYYALFVVTQVWLLPAWWND